MSGMGFDLGGGVDLAEETTTSNKICPNWNVILLNTDYHTMPFVVEVLMQIFKKDETEAMQKMLEVHFTGQSIITTCSKERAELYVEQVISKGGDPYSRDERAKNHLQVTMEPAE